MKHMIWIFHVIQMLPDSFGLYFMPELMQLVKLQRSIRLQVIEAKAKVEAEAEKPIHHDSIHPNIFYEVLQSDLPEEEKSVDRITDEALILIGAGTGTTAWCIGVATFHIISNPQILTRLKADLRAAIPDTSINPPLPVLERIPYLVAIAQEGLRLSYGVSSRTERISPDKALTYIEPSGRTWTIPAGTPLAMTCALIHHNEAIFPQNQSFVPERWLEDPRLDRHLVSFSKGSRSCLGINLALSEVYICLAALFRRFGSKEVRDEEDEGYLELFETTLEDVELSEDLFLPLPKRGSKGIRIKVRR
ncbi:MAG: hypothetical protein MMC33_004649 [Icmadophila ericetorum]|nr:hypothetical protein [Icmadophila ericetorum]